MQESLMLTLWNGVYTLTKMLFTSFTHKMFWFKAENKYSSLPDSVSVYNIICPTEETQFNVDRNKTPGCSPNKLLNSGDICDE